MYAVICAEGLHFSAFHLVLRERESLFLLLNFGFCSIATEQMKTFAIPFPLVDCNISPPSTSCVCVCVFDVWGRERKKSAKV